MLSCESGPTNNAQAFLKGKKIYTNYKSDLIQIELLCDSIFQDECAVFSIYSSPTTDLFDAKIENENRYKKGAISSVSETQMRNFTEWMPKPELNYVNYMKDLFVAFGISYTSYSENGIKLIKIEDLELFNKVYQYNELTATELSNDKRNWICSVHGEWFVTDLDLIHSGSNDICQLFE